MCVLCVCVLCVCERERGVGNASTLNTQAFSPLFCLVAIQKYAHRELLPASKHVIYKSWLHAVFRVLGSYIRGIHQVTMIHVIYVNCQAQIHPFFYKVAYMQYMQPVPA